jgi:hypothetical protein
MAKSEYIGLVLVEYQPGGKRYLFEAPYRNTLEAGDLVEVEDGDKIAKVIAAERYLDVKTDAKSIDLIVNAAEATLPLKKVTAYYEKRIARFEDEEGE